MSQADTEFKNLDIQDYYKNRNIIKAVCIPMIRKKILDNNQNKKKNIHLRTPNCNTL